MDLECSIFQDLVVEEQLVVDILHHSLDQDDHIGTKVAFESSKHLTSVHSHGKT